VCEGNGYERFNKGMDIFGEYQCQSNGPNVNRTRRNMKKILIIVVSVVLGAILTSFVDDITEGIKWKRLEYFSIPVDKLLAMKPFGREIWVGTDKGEIYKLVYPCQDVEPCWEKTEDYPILLNGDYVDEEVHEYIEYDVSSGHCPSTVDVGSLPGEIKTCITSIALAESFYTVSLVLTENHELWIWDDPWVSPYTVIENTLALMCVGSIIGLFIGIFLASNFK
jgi:hypothetical protein